MNFWENFMIAFCFVCQFAIVGVCLIIPIVLGILVSPWFYLSEIVILPFGFAVSEWLQDWMV